MPIFNLASRLPFNGFNEAGADCPGMPEDFQTRLDEFTELQ